MKLFFALLLVFLTGCSTTGFKRQITSDPPGVDVYVESLSSSPDRQYLGKTPLEVNFLTSFRTGMSKLIFEHEGQQRTAYISDHDSTNPHVAFDRATAKRAPLPPAPVISDDERFEAALLEARTKILQLLYVVSMTNDMRVTDRSYRNGADITVNIDVALVSDDARSAFANEKLQRNSYPAFRRVYEEALGAHGFSNVYVQINTNPFASR